MLFNGIVNVNFIFSDTEIFNFLELSFIGYKLCQWEGSSDFQNI